MDYFKKCGKTVGKNKIGIRSSKKYLHRHFIFFLLRFEVLVENCYQHQKKTLSSFHKKKPTFCYAVRLLAAVFSRFSFLVF